MEQRRNNLMRVKRLVPAGVKSAVRDALRERQFSRAVRRVAGLPVGERPSREMLETRGHVLECGSGLTSILLGLLAGRRGFDTWSLEHFGEWRERVAASLARNKVGGVRVCDAPLKSYGGFAWYDPPKDEMPREFGLVICDGPPGSTEGGRYGLLPVLGSRLAAGAVVLLDDAEREGEADVLDRWTRETRMSAEMRDTPTGTFAVVTLG